MARGLTPPDVAVHRDEDQETQIFFVFLNVKSNSFFSLVPSDPIARGLTPPDVAVHRGQTRKTEKKRIILYLL